MYAQGVMVRGWFRFSMDHWNLYDSSPAWNHATLGTVEEKLANLSDPELLRVELREEEPMLESIGEQTRPAHLSVLETPGHPELEKYIGMKVSEIAEAEGKHVVDAMLDLSVAGDLKVVFRGGVTLASDPAKVGEVMRDQYTLAGASDGGAHTKFITAGSFTTDFLIWLVRDTKQLSLEEAHYHLSYLPAQAAGLLDRGFLREGAPADIVVYDLENLKLTPESNYEAAHDVPANEWRLVQYSEGYRYTLVNGEITFEDGKCTGATPGLLLRNRQIGTDPLAVAAGR